MIIIKSELGEKLRLLRKEKCDTLSVVSTNTSISLALLSKIERGERLPTKQQLSILAIYYSINESDLKALLVAEKIIKEYGLSKETLKSIKIVENQIKKYIKK